MIIPIFIRTGPRKPDCVCPACGHQFDSPQSESAWIFVTALFLVAVLFWFGLTLAQWFIPIRGNPSLVDVLLMQWHWLTSLRVW